MKKTSHPSLRLTQAARHVGLGFLAIFISASCAQAQSTGLTADEMKPIYAMASDIADGKELAASSCAKCHGLDGVSTVKGTPHLAGQRPSYLYRELQDYKNGKRSHQEMTDKVKFLSEDALVKVAAYYASLEPAPVSATKPPASTDPVQAGKSAAASCVTCHGETGISKKVGVPNLIGFEPKYLVEAMKAYKSDDRKVEKSDQEMIKALNALSDQQLEQIALYYGLQKTNLTRAQTPNLTANPPNKESLAICAKCHGEDGIGTSPASPSIAGQEAAYMLKALISYKDGSRDDDVMSPRAAKLSEEDMKALTAYYSALPPKAPNLVQPLTTAQWAEKCDHCHGNGGNSIRPTVPALAAQHYDYLVTVMTQYRSGARKSSEMSAMSSVLSDDDIAGLAGHYASQKARTFVFVTVQGK